MHLLVCFAVFLAGVPCVGLGIHSSFTISFTTSFPTTLVLLSPLSCSHDSAGGERISMEPCLVMPFFFSLSSFLPPSSFQPPSSPFFQPIVSRFLHRYGSVGPLRVPAIIGRSLHLLMYIVFFFSFLKPGGCVSGHWWPTCFMYDGRFEVMMHAFLGKGEGTEGRKKKRKDTSKI